MKYYYYHHQQQQQQHKPAPPFKHWQKHHKVVIIIIMCFTSVIWIIWKWIYKRIVIHSHIARSRQCSRYHLCCKNCDLFRLSAVTGFFFHFIFVATTEKMWNSFHLIGGAFFLHSRHFSATISMEKWKNINFITQCMHQFYYWHSIIWLFNSQKNHFWLNDDFYANIHCYANSSNKYFHMMTLFFCFSLL